MYNKSKPHPSIKIEKENENIKLRKKIKCFSTDKHLNNKKETVWERLSKLKKVSSVENIFEVAGSRRSLNVKTSQRCFQPAKQLPFKHSTQPGRKPLIATSASVNKGSSVPQRMCMKEVNAVIEYDKPTLVAVVNARSLSKDSRSSSDSKVTSDTHSKTLANGTLRINDQKCNESSSDSNEEYILAPLLVSHSEDGDETCTRTVSNIRELVRDNNKSMAFEDIKLVTDVATRKSDSKCGSIERDPKLFKDILKSQLQNILMHEFPDKKNSDSLQQQSLVEKSAEPMTKIVSYSGHNKETQKFEVDIIFKNVPSLDKEIAILKALGEKLESTLKSTACHRTRHDAVSQTFILPTTQPPFISEEKDAPVIVKLLYRSYELSAECHAEVSVYLIGLRHCLGVVKEFRMAQKSIVELKRESDRPFYIPSNSESVQLIKTSFERLKETPNELLRHVKPKNSQVAFNVLEQDSVFFYYAFNKLSNIRNLLSTNCDPCAEPQQPIKGIFSEDGNSHFCNTSNQEVHKTETKIMNLFTSKSKNENDPEKKLLATPTIPQPIIRGKQRRRIRTRMTPMPIGSDHCPKNSLLTTVIVGFVQLSVFIVFIMALTYPDVRC